MFASIPKKPSPSTALPTYSSTAKGFPFIRNSELNFYPLPALVLIKCLILASIVVFLPAIFDISKMAFKE